MRTNSIMLSSILLASSAIIFAAGNQAPANVLFDKDYKLYGSLVKPQARSDSQFQTATTNICGGTTHGPTHYLTTQNITNIFQWYIHTPSESATCLLRFATVNDPVEKDFKVLKPVDQNSFYEDGKYIGIARSFLLSLKGSFPCGREKGIESRTIRFTGYNSCDHCVIEWIWNTPQGKLRECADIMVAAGEDVKCLGMCQNGGICSKGICICPAGYSGTYCQNSGGVSGTVSVLVTIFLVILAIILIALAAFFFLYRRAQVRQREAEEKSRYGTVSNFGQVSQAQPANVNQRFEDDLDTNQRAFDNASGIPARRLRQEEFKE